MPELATPESLLSDFYFLVFSSNPSTQRVKVFVDEGKLKFTVTKERFLGIIEKYLGTKFRDTCMEPLTEYGTFYLISRKEGILKKLYRSDKIKKLNPSAAFKTAKSLQTTDDFYKETEEYRKALQAKLDDAIKSEDNKKDIKMSNNSGFIDMTNVNIE